MKWQKGKETTEMINVTKKKAPYLENNDRQTLDCHVTTEQDDSPYRHDFLKRIWLWTAEYRYENVQYRKQVSRRCSVQLTSIGHDIYRTGARTVQIIDI